MIPSYGKAGDGCRFNSITFFVIAFLRFIPYRLIMFDSDVLAFQLRCIDPPTVKTRSHSGSLCTPASVTAERNACARLIGRNKIAKFWPYALAAFLLGGIAIHGQSLTPARREGPLWVASNASMEIGINTTSGTIERLRDKISNVDYCDQKLQNATADTDGNTGIPFAVGLRPGGLELMDELRQKVFTDLTDSGTISRIVQSSTSEEVSISFDKQFVGAEFVVTESFRLTQDTVRWDVSIRKSSGPDRTVRVTHFLPLPLGRYQAWAPISDAPFTVKPWLPFSIDYGQSTSGAIGEGRWRTTVPLMVFYSKAAKRALAIAAPFDVPAVRIRFLSNTGAEADFHWNSRQYPMRERPYLQITNEYLGLRDGKDLHTALLISSQPSDWRPSLGWLYAKYKDYFDPSPGFEKWDGAYDGGYSLLRDGITPEEVKSSYADEYAHGVRWEELHGHFLHYGSMIPELDVRSWKNVEPSYGYTMTREKIEQHCRASRAAGIGTFLYYNVTESEHRFAKDKFSDSVAADEAGRPIGAFRSQLFPDDRACWLMNADPSTGFGKYMIQQAKDMVTAYPDAAGFFWDVYGRSYMFDFAHDDGITMVNNKPAYYPEFMYQRLMNDYVGPLLHSKGMHITANKPVTVVSTRGIDGIMTMENAPNEESPAWISAQSFLGLNRHIMILEHDPAQNEILYLHCLRYGAFHSPSGEGDPTGTGLSPELVAYYRDLEKKYLPFIEMFRGKQWIFYPEALELPENTFGNIFRLKDGSVMITMVSAWRVLRHADGFDVNLEVNARLPDAASIASVEVYAVDRGEKTVLAPTHDGDRLRIIVPKHGKATVILLRPKGWHADLNPSAPR